MSLSKLQHDHQQKQQNSLKSQGILRPRGRLTGPLHDGISAPILREPSFLQNDCPLRDETATPYFYSCGENDDLYPTQSLRPKRSKDKPLSSRDDVPSSPKRASDPRLYASTYYATQLAPPCSSRSKSADPPSRGRHRHSQHHRHCRPDSNPRPNQRHDNVGNPRSSRRNVPTTLPERAFHQKMADCLMLAADLYQLDREGSSLDNSREYPSSPIHRSTTTNSRTGRPTAAAAAAATTSAVDTSNDDTVETDEITDGNTNTTTSSGIVTDTREHESLRSYTDLHKSTTGIRRTDRGEPQAKKRGEPLPPSNRPASTLDCSFTTPSDDDHTFVLPEPPHSTPRHHHPPPFESMASRLDNCSTIESGEPSSSGTKDSQPPLPPSLPRVLSWTRTSDSVTSPTSVILPMNPDDFEPNRHPLHHHNHPPLHQQPSRQLPDTMLHHNVSDNDVRDTQRRPRGRYEESVLTKPTKPPLIAHPRSELHNGTSHVPATDDDDATRASRPYDESSVGRSSRPPRAITDEPLSTQDRVQLEVLSTKYELAMHDMACQEKVVQNLRYQLSAAQKAVKAVQHELQLAQTESTKRSQVFEEATRKIFRERIDVDERLRRELQANQQYQTVVTNLQQEIAHLSQELQRAQEQSTKEANSETSIVETTNEAAAEAQTSIPTPALDRATMDADQQNLRSSVANLEEQLKDKKLAHTLASQEIESLKMERADAQAQIARLTQELMRVVDESTTNNDQVSGGDGAEQLQNEIILLQEELEQANQRAEESFAIRKKLGDEMAGFEVEAMQYGSRVARMEEQLQEARAEAQREASSKDVEAKELRVEVNELKKALSERNSEIVRQAAEHLKERRYLEDELRHWKQNAQCLRNYTNSTDECSGTAESDATVPCRPSQTRAQPRTENMSSTILMDILRKKLDSK
jgi:hypothetical protein